MVQIQKSLTKRRGSDSTEEEEVEVELVKLLARRHHASCTTTETMANNLSLLTKCPDTNLTMVRHQQSQARKPVENHCRVRDSETLSRTTLNVNSTSKSLPPYKTHTRKIPRNTKPWPGWFVGLRYQRHRKTTNHRPYTIRIEVITAKTVKTVSREKCFLCRFCNQPFATKGNRNQHQEKCEKMQDAGRKFGRYFFKEARSILAKVTRGGITYYLVDWFPSGVPVQFVRSVGPIMSMLDRSGGDKDLFETKDFLLEIAITPFLVRKLVWEFENDTDYPRVDSSGKL